MVAAQLAGLYLLNGYGHTTLLHDSRGLAPKLAIGYKVGLQMWIVAGKLIEYGQHWRNVSARAPAGGYYLHASFSLLHYHFDYASCSARRSGPSPTLP